MNKRIDIVGHQDSHCGSLQTGNEEGKEEPCETGLQLMISKMEMFPSSVHWKESRSNEHQQ